MPIYSIETTPKYQRAYRKLPPDLKEKEIIQVNIFRNNPFDPRLKTHRLKGKLKGKWSFSVTYSYRIFFKFADKGRAIFYDIGPHDIYK